MAKFEQRSLNPVAESAPEAVSNASGGYAPAASLLERAYLFLEDGEFARADEYFEKVLDLEPKNPRAYLGKLLVKLQVKNLDELRQVPQPFEKEPLYDKIVRFGDPELIATLTDANNQIRVCCYQNACSVMEMAQSEEDFLQAAKLFAAVGQYQDAAAMASVCEEKAKLIKATIDQQDAVVRQVAHKKTIRKRILLAAMACVTALCAVVLCARVVGALQKRREARVKAAALAASYNYAESLISTSPGRAAIEFGKLGDYQDAKERSFALWDQVAQRDTVFASGGISHSHTVGVKVDGSVVAVGDDNFDASDWTDIIAVAAGDYHMVGLKADGTAVAVGGNVYGQCDVSGWTGIIAISASSNYTVGLRVNGTVVMAGECGFDVSDWTGLVAVSAGDGHIVGLRANGTVVATGYNGDGRCDVSDWTDIIAVSAGCSHTVGLKANGTVVAVGNNYRGKCDVSGWTDIVAIAAGGAHTVGLKSNGSVVAVGDDSFDVSDWTGLVAVSAGDRHIVGLRANGTVVATGYNGDGRCNVSGWRNIKVP